MEFEISKKKSKYAILPKSLPTNVSISCVGASIYMYFVEKTCDAAKFENAHRNKKTSNAYRFWVCSA